jgi:hypothetical protein
MVPNVRQPARLAAALPQGPCVPYSNLAIVFARMAKRAGVACKRNGLRHSWIWPIRSLSRSGHPLTGRTKVRAAFDHFPKKLALFSFFQKFSCGEHTRSSGPAISEG